MELAYFFDTYALIEVAKGENASYRKYLSAKAFTTKLNLLELYFAFIRENQKEAGRRLFRGLSKACIPIPDDALIEAAEMRFQFLKMDVSYVDCIGYILSQKLGIPFLTGDSKFKEFSNTEFVR